MVTARSTLRCTVVVAVDMLFPGFGSVVALAATALLVMVAPFAVLACIVHRIDPTFRSRCLHVLEFVVALRFEDECYAVLEAHQEVGDVVVHLAVV